MSRRRALCCYGGCLNRELTDSDDGMCADHRGMTSPSPPPPDPADKVRGRTGGRVAHERAVERGERMPRPVPEGLPFMPRKEDVACCMAQLDHEGRPPIGFCGPDCDRRAARDVRLYLAGT